MIVFLVRQFNDIDHIVPIIYRMLKDRASDVGVFCMDPSLNVHNDFRLRYLSDTFGCETRYIYEAYLPSIAHRLFALLVCQAPHWRYPQGLRWVSRVADRVATRLNSRLRDKLYNQVWAARFLQADQVKCLVIDWGRKGRFIYAAISDAADELGVRKVGVPHGLNTIKNMDWTNTAALSGTTPPIGKNWGWIGEFAVQSQVNKRRYVLGGLPDERTHVLGSARFCREWLEIYHRILPAHTLPPSNGKLKVIYFDTAAEYRVNTEAVVSSLHDIANLDFVEVIVKPSTRMALSDQRLAHLCNVGYATHSVHLIQWADVVMGFLSSILLEAYDLNRIFLYPKYFHQNEMLWEDFGACWTVLDQDELVGALRGIYGGQHEPPYSRENVQAFLTEIVYGGDPKADVLGNYVNFILEAPSYLRAEPTNLRSQIS